MCIKIAGLAYREKDQPSVIQPSGDFRVRCIKIWPNERRRPVYPVRKICAGCDPVMTRVAEDIEDWHRGVGEAVEKESLELTFYEVRGYEDHGKGLEGSGWVVTGRGGRVVDVGSEEVDEGVDEDGPCIFDDKDCAPGDLWS